MSKAIPPMLLAALTALLSSLAWPQTKPLALATTSDLGAIVQAVAGDLIELQVILPPGADPHAFNIGADQIQAFRHGDLIVYAHSEYHEFETAIKSALPDMPALDWQDYAAQGATLRDDPGYPQNPHGPWLRLDNAAAIARAVAERLGQMGLPGPVLRGRLQLFEKELGAQSDLCLWVAQEHGLSGRSMLAVIPGVCDIIANFGLPVGDVLMAEGSGTVAGKRLQETVAKLRNGQYAAIVCPLSMRQSKQGEAARQVARDSGAPIIYVHFLDLHAGKDTYLSQRADEIAAVASITTHAEAATPPAADRLRLVRHLLLAAAGFIAGLIVAARLRRRRGPSCGAGIFDKE